MAPSGLNTVPVELLAQICYHLCWYCQDGHLATITAGTEGGLHDSSFWRCKEQASLLSLSRTCKATGAVSQPHLYHYLNASKEGDLYYYIRTLMERPDLGLWTTEIDVDHADGVPAKMRAGSHPLTRVITTEVENHLQRGNWAHFWNTLTGGLKLSYVPQEEILDGFSDVREAAEYVALISRLLQLAPNLTRAHIVLMDYAPFEMLPRPSDGFSLPKLRALAFSNSTECQFVLDQAAPIIRLAPHLAEMHCHHCATVTELFSASLGCSTLDEPPPLQNLATLSLMDCKLAAVSLRNLLGAIGPALSKVSILPRPWLVSTAEEHAVSFEEALAELRPWRKRLKELSFRVSYLDRPHYSTDGVRILREFKALQNLQVELELLRTRMAGHAMLTSIVPPCVQELSLRGDGFLMFEEALQALLAAFLAGRYQELRRIEIDDEEYHVESPEWQQWRDIEAAFRSAGVEFMVHAQLEEIEMGESDSGRLSEE